MTDTLESDGSVSAEGTALLEEGRRVRAERARSRTLRGRIDRVFADRPAWLRGVALGVLLTLSLCIVAVAVDVVASYGRVHPGVRIGEVRVGAMSAERAAAAVEETFGPRLADPVAVTFEDEVWQTDAETLAVSLDSEALVAEAMEYGRSGSLTERIAARFRLWLEPVTVAVVVEADSAAVDAFLAQVASVVEREPRDAQIAIEGTQASIEPSVLGIALRKDEVREDVLRAFAATERDIEASVDFTPVRVTDGDAEQALLDTRAMLAGPVTVTDEVKSWEFSAREIAPWIAFRVAPAPAAGTTATADADTAAEGDAVDAAQGGADVLTDERWVLEAYISADEASATVLARVGEAGTPPVDARFEVGAGTVRIIPSRDGVGIDVEALATEMTRVLTTEEQRTVQLRTRRLEPEITTERAEQMGIKERFATYTTTFLSGNQPRLNNIHTLADALNGTLLAPGETFSFNGTIGDTTAAKGYQEAATIVEGRIVPSLGGGICQVATTLFNTVFESGLPVVERRNHSLYISTYPKGRDATISWGGVDFKFKNDTDHWVYIATSYTNTSVTVSLYGTDPGYEVTGLTGQFTDIKPFTTKEVPDATLLVGTRVVEDAGVDGRRVVVKRTVLKGDTVVREDTFTSTYSPKQQIVRVGTKQPASSESTASVPIP